MKIRNDFVTNSSSSSFLLAFKNKEDGLQQIARMVGQYGNDCILELLRDFDEATPIAKDELRMRYEDEYENDAWWELCSFGWRGDKTFCREWFEAHPGATDSEYEGSAEYAAEKQRLERKYFQEMMDAIGDREYIVELSYGDHWPVGSELEHHILPDQPFVAQIFNHH
jgi:hypothetical protein